jgi:hypothetical protein
MKKKTAVTVIIVPAELLRDEEVIPLHQTHPRVTFGCGKCVILVSLCLFLFRAHREAYTVSFEKTNQGAGVRITAVMRELKQMVADGYKGLERQSETSLRPSAVTKVPEQGSDGQRSDCHDSSSIFS